MAKKAYQGADQPIRTPRGIEYDAFARVTHGLKSANSGQGQDFPALARALHENRRLWTALAVDVADPGNKLPASLRARIFYLAEFTQVHTQRILTTKSTPDVLIDINTAMMRGLRGEGDGA